MHTCEQDSDVITLSRHLHALFEVMRSCQGPEEEPARPFLVHVRAAISATLRTCLSERSDELSRHTCSGRGKSNNLVLSVSQESTLCLLCLGAEQNVPVVSLAAHVKNEDAKP